MHTGEMQGSAKTSDFIDLRTLDRTVYSDNKFAIRSLGVPGSNIGTGATSFIMPNYSEYVSGTGGFNYRGIMIIGVRP